MSDPTTTDPATVLSAEHVRKMLGATGFIDPPDAAKDMRDLCRAYLAQSDHIDALAAQVRVLAEALEGTLIHLRHYVYTDEEAAYNRARSALAALEEGAGDE